MFINVSYKKLYFEVRKRKQRVGNKVVWTAGPAVFLCAQHTGDTNTGWLADWKWESQEWGTSDRSLQHSDT